MDRQRVLHLIEGRLRGDDRLMEHFGELDRFHSKLDAAARDSRHVEQVVDEAGQMRQLATHDGQLVVERLAALASDTDELKRGHDRRKRIAQLVGEHRQKLVLAPVGVTELRVQPRRVRQRALHVGARGRERGAQHARVASGVLRSVQLAGGRGRGLLVAENRGDDG